MTLEHELGLDRPFEDLRHEAVLNIVRTASQLSGAAANLFRRFGLTEAQFNVLLLLKYATGELTQSDLGRRLVVTRASMTSVLDKLEAKALVVRRDVPGNRRAYHVALTEKGATLLEQVEPEYRADVHDVLTDLTDDECRALIRHLELVRARARHVTEVS